MHADERGQAYAEGVQQVLRDHEVLKFLRIAFAQRAHGRCHDDGAGELSETDPVLRPLHAEVVGERGVEVHGSGLVASESGALGDEPSAFRVREE